MKFFSKPNQEKRLGRFTALEDIDAEVEIEINEGPTAEEGSEVNLDDSPVVDSNVDPVTGEPVDLGENGDVSEPVDVELEVDGDSVDLGVAGQDTDLDDGAAELEASADEDLGAEELVAAVESLEGLQLMVSAMPDVKGKIDRIILTGMRPALEANDIVAQNSTALVPTDGDKRNMMGNIKDFMKKALEALIKMVMGFLDGIKAAWANATDRLVRAANAAKSMKTKLASTKFTANASISDEKLMGVIATAGNISVVEAMANAFGHAQAMGERATSELLGNAGVAIRAIASGRAQEDTMQKLYGNIEAIAGTYSEKGVDVKGKQANATKPFFGGYRAWCAMPDSMDDISGFAHGLEKIDEVGAQGQLNAASQQECDAICDAVIEASKIVPQYRTKMAEEERLVKEIKSAANPSGEGTEEAKAQMQKLTKILPKIVKGPQVAAYSYAGTAAAIGMRYVSASVAAQSADGAGDVKALGNEKAKLPAPSRSGPGLPAPAAA